MTRKRLKVSVPESAPGTAPSLACYFPSGQQSEQGPPSTSYNVYESSNSRGAKAYTIIGQKDNIEYVGDTRGDEYTPGLQPCNFVMGVLDKDNGTLQLLPLSSARVLRMEPRLPGLQYGAAARAGAEDEGNAEESREERLAHNKRLVEAFGSTRRRRQLNAREEGTVRVEKLGDSADALQAYMGKVATDAEKQGFTKDKVLGQVSAARQLPPHNLEARSPWEAYPWDSLVPNGAADQVKTGRLIKCAHDVNVEKDVREKRQADPYVLSRLPLLRDPHLPKPLMQQRVRYLSFLSSLLSLKGARSSIQVDPASGGLEKKAKDFRMDSQLLEALLSAFYHCSHHDGRTKYDQDKELQSRMIAHICVAALLAEPNACISPSSCLALSESLKMPLPDLVLRFKEVGATVVPSNMKAEETGGQPVRSYTMSLLPDQKKTLGEALPPIKLPAKRK